MNKELRELFKKNNIITKKITLKNNIRIVSDGTNKYVIKKRYKDLKKLYEYLKTRNFNYYPKIIYQTNNYDIYEYINNIEISEEEKSIDLIKLVSILHSKTTFYKEIDDNTYKELYENINNHLDYLYHYYDDIANTIEQDEYMSPSNYFFIRNITLIFKSISYAKKQINKWYSIIEEKKKIRLVNIHNNLKLDNYLLSDKPYLISWQFSKKDLPIYDLLNLYKYYYKELDFCNLIKIYESNYPLLKEEKILLFVLISIPEKIEFNKSEFKLCQVINDFYDYLLSSEKLIKDYVIE